MTVALGTTLINMKIHDLLKFGHWTRIEDAITNGTDIFIGAGVTRKGETKPYVDLCAHDEALSGIVLGYNKQLETIHANGYYYNDYDNPFGTGKKILIGVPIGNETVNLILLATGITVAVSHRLKCVDGVFSIASTDEDYQYVAEEPSTGASNTRKYIFARFVGAG